MAAYKLVLIRHGESAWNLENRFSGWYDADLSPAGHEEAKRGGQALRGNGAGWVAVRGLELWPPGPLEDGRCLTPGLQLGLQWGNGRRAGRPFAQGHAAECKGLRWEDARPSPRSPLHCQTQAGKSLSF
jgi:hypothetical protein